MIIFGELLYVCFVYLILLLGKASFVLIKCPVILKVICFVYLSVELFLIHFESFHVNHLSASCWFNLLHTLVGLKKIFQSFSLNLIQLLRVVITPSETAEKRLEAIGWNSKFWERSFFKVQQLYPQAFFASTTWTSPIIHPICPPTATPPPKFCLRIVFNFSRDGFACEQQTHHVRYRISSNNSRPSINRLPRIIASLWWKYLKLSPPSNNHPSPAPFAIFSSFYPFCVKLKRNEIQQNWSVTIQALKINQATKFGTLKNPCSVYFDVIIFWFNGKIKQNI